MTSSDNRKILLVQPPIRDFYFTSKRSIPYGLLSIASFLRKKGFEISLIDALATSRSRKISTPDEMSYLNVFYGKEDISPFALFNGYKHFGNGFENIAKRAAESEAFLVGISSMFTAYSEMALETARVIRRELPYAHIVMGGHHATEMPEHLLGSPAVDYVIRGEGENSMAMLAEAIISGNTFDGIEGLVYRDKNGGVTHNGRAVIENLHEIPLPASDLMDHRFYSRKDGGSAVITSSRGCPLKCSYCCVGSANIKWRKRTPDKILEEIRINVEDYGARFIDFEDENLSLDRIWFSEILDSIIEQFPGLELRAMNGLFPPSMTPDIMIKMKNAGFRTLNLSVGSTSSEQLKRFNRPDIMNCLEEVLDNADKAGLECVCYIIASAPDQSHESSVDDLLFFAEKKALVGVSVYYPAPGSRDYGRLENEGLLPSSFSLMRSSAMPIAGPESRTGVSTLMRLGRILNFMKAARLDDKTIKPEKLDSGKINISDRMDAGITLINSFFHDFRIRGIDRNGKIHEHLSSEDLCRRFVTGIMNRKDIQ